MMKQLLQNRLAAIIGFFLFLSFQLKAQTIRFEIKSVPAATDPASQLYAAGQFNNWNPRDENFRFKKDDKGTYYLEIKLTPGTYEYKITRGSWEKVECKKDGSGVQNRRVNVEGDQTEQLVIEEWQDRFPPKPKVSTASSHVCVLDTAFTIPQLQRNRRISVYLPPDYCNNKMKYPVLYLHDGQNVFDDSTSYSGEWGIDEFLDTTTLRNCIVVAIDNGGNKRMNEYNGYDNDRFGKGEGKAYVDFLTQTLRPFINKHFRVKKERENTWVAGSSMGGLISLYAILEYPKIFGGAGVFSPAFWTAPKIFDDIRLKGQQVKGSIYFYCGKQEGEMMVPDMLRAFQEMATVSKARMETVIRDEGRHNEATWRKEFPLFYRWLIGTTHK